jgi:hypothetical protein
MNEMNEEGKSLSQYLANPFVLIGIGALIYWYISRRKLLLENPNINPSIRFLDSSNSSNFIGHAQSKAKKHRVPVKLVQDVEKMDKKQIARMILSNQEMINKTQMPNDERNQILNMVSYLEFELDNKE